MLIKSIPNKITSSLVKCLKHPNWIIISIISQSLWPSLTQACLFMINQLTVKSRMRIAVTRVQGIRARDQSHALTQTWL